MDRYRKMVATILVVLAIVLVIFFIERSKVNRGGDVEVVELATVEEKAEMYESAKEITTPDGFINTDPFILKDLIGKKVILIDFWTYSCINCQRTTPYLNAWHTKYEDEGLVIVGIHTPEFGFEKEYDNVLNATRELGIEFHVVLDNDFSTWQAYRNRYWPRKYLIDIDGYIVYDHIGEGAYEETEEAIQRALKERGKKLGIDTDISSERVEVDVVRAKGVGSPEVYFGAWRNEFLANGVQKQKGSNTYTLPSSYDPNKLYLGGGWTIEDKFARSEGDASFVFWYQASKVHMVLGAPAPTEISVYKDDVFLKTVTVDEETLYTLIDDDESGQHVIRVEVPEGVEVFTFTFG